MWEYVPETFGGSTAYQWQLQIGQGHDPEANTWQNVRGFAFWPDHEALEGVDQEDLDAVREALVAWAIEHADDPS